MLREVRERKPLSRYCLRVRDIFNCSTASKLRLAAAEFELPVAVERAPEVVVGGRIVLGWRDKSLSAGV